MSRRMQLIEVDGWERAARRTRAQALVPRALVALFGAGAMHRHQRSWTVCADAACRWNPADPVPPAASKSTVGPAPVGPAPDSVQQLVEALLERERRRTPPAVVRTPQDMLRRFEAAEGNTTPAPPALTPGFSWRLSQQEIAEALKRARNHHHDYAQQADEAASVIHRIPFGGAFGGGQF